MTAVTEQTTTANSRLKWYTLGAACFALFMAVLDNLVLNVALPSISRDLQATTTQLQWIVSAYTLVFASLQITAGGLGDRFGRKRWFMIGLTVFTGASILGALSQNMATLIFARTVQGLGASFIMPLSLSIIAAAFPPEERGRALGIWGAISVSGLAFGPIVGGALVDYANWHWAFGINVPIGIGALVVTGLIVRESRDESGTVATDIPGTVLVTGAIGALVWGLIEAGNRGWGDTLILASFAAAAILFALFVAVEARTARPMVPLRFFRSRTFTGANIVAFVISFLIAGVAFFLTLYQQNIHGFSAVRSGLALLPMVTMMMIGSPLSGSLVGRVGPSRLIAFGMIVAGIGTLLLMRGGPDARYIAIVPGLVVMGLGMSFIFAPSTTAVLNSVESAKSGVASAVNGAIREIGAAVSIALLGTIMNRIYKAEYNASPEIGGLRADPAAGPLRPLLDLVGSGASFAGRVIEDPTRFPGLGPVAGLIREASSRAFVAGMDRAILVGSLTVIVGSVLAFLLIDDRVAAATETGDASGADGATEETLAPAIAD